MLDTSARLLALLSLLQLRREWTGQELAQRLEVDPRTIRRDVNKLRSLDYPVEASAGAGGGYRLAAGAELPPLMLDNAEAVAVAVGLRTASSAPIAGIEETSLQALAKLEQVLPRGLRDRVRAIAETTSCFAVEGPRIDAEVLATLAGACRGGERVHFTYVSAAEQRLQRHVEPSALVHSGYRWYLLAFDLDRDDWRTFRIDRVRGDISLGDQGAQRQVPGGDAAAYVQRIIGSEARQEAERAPGRVRVAAPMAQVAKRIPQRYATVTADGEDACIVTSDGGWSRLFLVHIALLDYPLDVLGPAELADAAGAIAARLRPPA